jgi:molybdenum cofactor biosynthesis enzyme MoaA
MLTRRLFLLLNDYCDSKCRLCNYWTNCDKHNLTPNQIISKVIPFVKENQIEYCCISGGEPTLHPELSTIIKLLKEVGLTTTLITSTTNLEIWFNDIKEYLDAYMISVDGASKEVYKKTRGIDFFDSVLKWPSLIKKNNANANISFSFLIQKLNLHQIREIYHLALRHKVDRIFYRVPDIKLNSFGRNGMISNSSLGNCIVSENEILKLENDIRHVLLLDKENKILGQTEKYLLRKIDWLRKINNYPVSTVENDEFCDVPFTSVVLDHKMQLKPCFYLPLSEDLQTLQNNNINFSKSVYEACNSILKSKQFRNKYCKNCQQFDGHKHTTKTYG